jgi:hypothetical protein
MTCARCDNSIDNLLAEWEARGCKGRKPKFCRDPECRRVRTAARQRKHRHKPKVRHHEWAKGGNHPDALPPEIDFIDPETWHATVGEETRLEALYGPEHDRLEAEDTSGRKVVIRVTFSEQCVSCGATIPQNGEAVTDDKGHRCLACALAA